MLNTLIKFHFSLLLFKEFSFVRRRRNEFSCDHHYLKYFFQFFLKLKSKKLSENALNAFWRKFLKRKQMLKIKKVNCIAVVFNEIWKWTMIKISDVSGMCLNRMHVIHADASHKKRNTKIHVLYKEWIFSRLQFTEFW